MRFAALLLLSLLFAAPVAAEEAIERYQSDIAVARDGTLRVEETIRVRAEGDQIKRGIFRDFPLTFEDAEGKVHEVGFKLVSVTRDGASEPHFTRREGEAIRIYAGEENTYLQRGQSYTYVFTYETDRQLRWFDGRPELYWNVTGNRWAFPILAASARVTFPDGALPVRWVAYTGPDGARGKDYEGTVSDGALFVRSTRTLRPGEGITIVAEIPAGAVAPPSSVDEARYYLRDNRAWIIGGIGLILVFAYYLFAWNAVGRDPKGGTIIPLFHPPEGISPALAAYVHNWGFGQTPWRAFTAAALSLAVKGFVVFDEEEKKELTLERTRLPASEVLPPGETAILSWVDRKGGVGRIAKDNAVSVADLTSKFKKAVDREGRGKFFKHNTLWFVIGLALTILVFIAILVFGGVNADQVAMFVPVIFIGGVFGIVVIPILRKILSSPSLGSALHAGMSLIIASGFIVFMAGQFLVAGAGDAYGILRAITSFIAAHPIPIALVLTFPALNGLFLYLLRAPTPLGRPVMDQIAGLRMYLETAESGRLNIADAPEITTEHFERLLPYAVALDVERPWADAFAEALKRAHPGDADPMANYHPRWSRGGGWSSGNFGRSVANTVSAASSALSASMPRSSSGSSGFSGGGGSGGGGGGGGGGGW